MALARGEVEALRLYYPSLKVIALAAALPVTVSAVFVAITGITGMNSRLRCRYDLIIDTTSLTEAIPAVWVRHPLDADIRHANIWPANRTDHSFCRWAGTDLPSFCWYEYGDEWLNSPLDSRTLAAALEYIKQFLNTENHDSAAR
jgi:hypothetical protein